MTSGVGVEKLLAATALNPESLAVDLRAWESIAWFSVFYFLIGTKYGR
jgi:hypothetical protein